MKAMVIHQHGGPEQLVACERPDPEPEAGEIRIRVVSSSVNPADVRARRSEPGPRAIARTFPLTLGYDVAGVVDRVGAAVDGFRVGDEVLASPNLAGPGAHAELVTVDARVAVHKPPTMAWNIAGVAPLVGLSAYLALFDRARVEAGERVLIHAGAGGVGHVAVQLAKARGCQVFATAGRDESVAFCRALGADEVLDRRDEDFDVALRRRGVLVDAVVDLVGGETLARSATVAIPEGRLVTLVPTAFGGSESTAFMRSLTLHYLMIGTPLLSNRQPERIGRALGAFVESVVRGDVRLHVARTFPVRELGEAHRLLEHGGFEGKLAIDVANGF